ncbi:MFS transporter [Streptomyces alkaliterrae]|uniref:MFS transporter n=1 Tax=Streptomyces alkaliterrae TaxID=2213162 RepID=A0A5P0YR06_9ACTN|nr:MFS transporter [Streptomyces alkaliterrae]MBB1258719.1 MFS transporter [Streptomyces alkaliterrae]MQS02695.1 MFS transporter [Streptomyces alkaliterrae]
MRSAPLPGWLYILFLTLLATATDEFVIAGVLPAVAVDLEVSVSAAGQLVTSFAVVYAVGAPTLSMACERLPKRTVLIVGLGLFAVANVAAAVAPGYWFLMAARVAAALCAAVVTAAAFATAAAGAPEGAQGRYLGLVTAGMTTALFSGVPLGAWLGGAFGWRATFWLIAAIGVIAAVGLLLTAPDVPGTAPAPLRARLAPLRDGAVLRLVATTFLAASGGLMFYTYLGPYTAEVAGPSYGLLSAVLLLVGVAGLAGALLAGRASDAGGPRRALRRTLAGHALALLLAAAVAFAGTDSRYVLALVVGCWAVVAWALNPPVQGAILAAAGPDAGMTALALNICGLYLGTAVAAAAGGAVIGTLGVAYVPLTAAALLLLSFLLAPRTAAARPVPGGVAAGRQQ